MGGLLGYLFMYGQLALLDVLGSAFGAFIPGLLSAVLTLVNGLIMIQFFIGLIQLCMLREAISDYAKASLERERKVLSSHRTSSSSSSDDSDFFDFLESSDVPVPVYVTDEDGNHYPVERRGDFIFIRTPQGEIETKWEYVRGQPYFDLHGKRYFPH